MDTTDPPAAHAFPPTHWSLVDQAGKGTGEGKRRALTTLLAQYLPAMRSHLLFRRGYAAGDVDDLLQGFLLSKVIERDLVSRADRTRGRFRTFLLTALDRFVSNQRRDARAAKRSGVMVPLEHAIDSAHAPGPAQNVFEVEWARQVLRQAIETMERECVAAGRPDVWAIFEARTLGPILRQEEPVPYGALVERFGFASPAQASNVLVTANRMFARNLRTVVRRYELDEMDVDQEINDLRAILGGARADDVRVDADGGTRRNVRAGRRKREP